jgi:hypothetical protein
MVGPKYRPSRKCQRTFRRHNIKLYVDVGSQTPRQSSDDLITFPAQESREFLAETIPSLSAKPRIQKPMDVIDLTAVELEVSRGNPIDMSANSAFNGEAKNKIVEVGPNLPIPTIEGEAL